MLKRCGCFHGTVCGVEAAAHRGPSGAGRHLQTVGSTASGPPGWRAALGACGQSCALRACRARAASREAACSACWRSWSAAVWISAVSVVAVLSGEGAPGGMGRIGSFPGAVGQMKFKVVCMLQFRGGLGRLHYKAPWVWRRHKRRRRRFVARSLSGISRQENLGTRSARRPVHHRQRM